MLTKSLQKKNWFVSLSSSSDLWLELPKTHIFSILDTTFTIQTPIDYLFHSLLSLNINFLCFVREREREKSIKKHKVNHCSQYYIHPMWYK